MVTDALRRELLSMESLIAVMAIVWTLPAVWLSGHAETMESGFGLVFVSAVYPPFYYREAGQTITSVPAGMLYGLATAAAVYGLFLLSYAIAQELSISRRNAELFAFVAVSILVFGFARIERAIVSRSEPETHSE